MPLDSRKRKLDHSYESRKKACICCMRSTMWKIVSAVFMMALILNCISVSVSAGQRRIVYFFYNNPCASCKEEDKIYDLFSDTFSTEEKQELNYELRAVNLFVPANKVFYEEICLAQKKDPDRTELPVLAAGDQWISGYSEIRARVRETMEDPSWTTAGTAVQNAGQKHISGETSGTDEAERQAFLQTLQKTADEYPQNAVLFITTACSDCKKAESMLDQADMAYCSLNVIEGSNYQGFSNLLTMRDIPEQDWKVPSLFCGDSLYTGTEEIRKALSKPDEIAGENTAQQLLDDISVSGWTDTAGSSPETARNAVSPAVWLQMAGEGILVGLNPCMISMLIMLLSVLLTAGRSALKTGLLYLAGKILTYAVLGMAIFQAFSLLTEETMERGQQITSVLLALLFLILSVLYFMDAYHAGRMEFGKVRMQLPERFRKLEHSAVSKAGSVSDKMLPLAAFLLGIGISVGEFFCSGQLYMASIIHLAGTQKTLRTNVWPMFLFFSAGIMIPSLILVLIISRTGKAEKSALFFAQHEAAIKAASGILFFIYAVSLVMQQMK